MDKKVSSLLNDQINKEFFSSYLYLSYANYFEEKGLSGFANWFDVQAQEEKDHAMLIVKYMHNNDMKIEYEAIKKPASSWANELEVLKNGLAHEMYITASINNIYATAIEEKDFRTTQFLDWFVKEQGEEEMNSRDLIRKAELINGESKGLYLLDQELSKRVYNPPTLVI